MYTKFLLSQMVFIPQGPGLVRRARVVELRAVSTEPGVWEIHYFLEGLSSPFLGTELFHSSLEAFDSLDAFDSLESL